MSTRRREPRSPVANRLLASLPAQEFERIEPDLEVLDLRKGQVLHEPGSSMRHVYFPQSGVLSMLTVLAGGDAIEIATIGREGMADTSVMLGSDAAASRLVVQVPGQALLLSTSAFRRHLLRGDALRAAVNKYLLALFVLVAQLAACNRLHPVTERCARWLLMTHDRVDSDVFPMTQDFLAEMLGVRRPSVTVAAGMLQKAGLIEYRRGRVRVVDRAGLEAAACECYAFVRERFATLPNAGR